MKIFRDGLEVETKDPPRILTRSGHVCEVFKQTDNTTIWFVTLKDTHWCAHGGSFNDAVSAAKEKESPGFNKKLAISRIKKNGRVSLSDFCYVTGACRSGAIYWVKQEGLSLRKTLPIKCLLKRLDKSASKSWGESLRKALLM